MNIDQFNSAVNGLLSNLASEVPLINARIARSALSLVHNRILNEGISGKSYSTNPLPLFFFTDKSISQGGEDRLKAKEKKNKKAGIIGVSYVDFRDAQNLQTDHVDLRLSGDMWRDADVTGTQQRGLFASSTIEFKGTIKYANGKSTAEIADYNGERYGNFLDTTEQEKEILEEALDDEADQLISKYFS